MSVSAVPAKSHDDITYNLLGVEYKARTTRGAELFYKAQVYMKQGDHVRAMDSLGQAVLCEQQFLRT